MAICVVKFVLRDWGSNIKIKPQKRRRGISPIRPFNFNINGQLIEAFEVTRTLIDELIKTTKFTSKLEKSIGKEYGGTGVIGEIKASYQLNLYMCCNKIQMGYDSIDPITLDTIR